VLTSPDSDDFRGAVYVTLSGMYGTNDEDQLVNDTSDGSNLNLVPFQAGSAQKFVLNVRAPGLGSFFFLLLRVFPLFVRDVASMHGQHRHWRAVFFGLSSGSFAKCLQCPRPSLLLPEPTCLLAVVELLQTGQASLPAFLPD
jgi:hypothetical protein